jgi:hypothetical protein
MGAKLIERPKLPFVRNSIAANLVVCGWSFGHSRGPHRLKQLIRSQFRHLQEVLNEGFFPGAPTSGSPF